jgi:Leucine-rich repeat (LRR) protein
MKRGLLLFFGIFLFLLVFSAISDKNRDFNVKVLDSKVEKKDIQTRAALKPDLNFGKFPLYFIANKGQVNDEARFYAKASGYTLWLTKGGLVFDSLKKAEVKIKSEEKETGVGYRESSPHSNSSLKYERDVSRLIFLNANKNPEIAPVEEAKLKVNYFIGNDSAKWHCDVPTSQAVLYKNLYRNIDLKVYGIEKEIEYDWVVQPGGNPEAVRFEYQNVKRTRIDDKGNLRIETKFGELIHKKPVSYQYIGDKKIMVEAGFNENGENSYGFSVEGYNKNYELIIDPVVLAYSTYLGGGSYEHGYGITVDNSGIVYVTGHTNSTDFPCLDQYSTDQGGTDVFVSKIDSNQSGTACLIYSTYLGGNGDDDGKGIAVDSTGNVYVIGNTYSVDFPTLNHYQVNQGDRDAFLVKMDTTSSGTAGLIYSTYLGGDSDDHGNGLAVGNNGYAYVVGSTYSDNFPILNQYQTNQLNSDAYVAVIDTTQSGTASLIYATYLGGSSSDYGHGIALDTSGYVYVTGPTISNDFPILNQYQTDPSSGGDFDVYVTKMDTTQSGTACLIYSTYIGGGDHDEGFGIAVDNSGNAYVTGYTESFGTIPSTMFPTRNAYQEKSGWFGFNSSDAFLIRIDTTQSGDSSLIYSTYLGGDNWWNEERGRGIAVDNNGCAYVAGYTGCSDFPILDQFQTNQGGDDAFVSKIDTNQSGAASLIFSTYLGGGGHDYGYAIALDSSGNVYVTGRTASYDFPTLNPYQTNSDDYWDDVFITKMAPPNIEIVFPDGNESLEAGSVEDIAWSSVGADINVKLEYSVDNGSNWSEIVSSTENDGSFPWTIPGTISDQCLVRISEIDGSPSDTSDNVFSIIPSIKVTFPDGGESFEAGSIQNITWSSIGVESNVKIEYSTDEGSSWSEIISSTPNSGSYMWTIPPFVSSLCLIKVSEIDGSPSDISDDLFSIVPVSFIMVTAPNWNENLEVGSFFNITWYTTDLPGNLNIEYSTDNGSNWENIASSTENDGIYPWLVPDSLSSSCLIRISKTDGAISDITDNTFSIVPATSTPSFSLNCTATVPDHAELGQEIQFVADFSISGHEGTLLATDNIVGNMRYVPLTGSRGFIQGAPETDPGHSPGWDDQFTHILTRNIAVMETEVTRQMWADLKAVQPTLPDDPSNLTFSFYLNQPTQYVSWYEAILFANLLSLQNELTPCYYTNSSKTTLIDSTNYSNNDTIFCDFSANGYRLPTEGEWEYFTRAGTTTPFWIDEPNFNSNTLYTCTQGDLAALETATVFCANSGNMTSSSGSKLGNPWNLFDVHGNVSELCWDQFISPYPTGTVTDYTGPSSGSGRVLRGGSFIQDALRCRSAYRTGASPGNPNFYYGFRLVRTHSAPSTSYEWSFGDLEKAYERTATHVYESSAFYGWRLTVNHDGQICEKTGTINITPPNSLEVTFPDGGETFEVGTIQEIRWTIVGIFEYVKIEYSIDNGTNWTEIDSSTENDGSYLWMIPDTISSQCLIRISEVDGDAIDSSNEVFSIITPLGTIMVTSPNGGESYEVSTSQAITWVTTGTIGNVTIEFSSDNGSSWLECIRSTENDGYHPWSIPNQVSSQCLVRISETDGFPSDVSDAAFSILPLGSTITVTSPNGGESWEAGSTQNITWDAPGLLEYLKIEYSIDNGATWKIITSSTSDDGSYSWLIPNVVSSQCIVRISETDGHPTDISDSTFYIYSNHPFINVTFPDGGETLEGLSLQNITWTSHDVYGYVKAEYSTDGGNNWNEIVSSTVNVGSYPWSVPNGPLYNCFVRVSTVAGTIEDKSNSGFMVSFTEWRIPEIERLALIDLYNSTNGDSWTTNSGWKDGNGFTPWGTENSWYGVVVIGNAYVEWLDLRENNLTGNLPDSIGNFAYIKWIDFYNNNITGYIPSTIGNLSNLQQLYLTKNQLSNVIPYTIGNLTNLVFLYLNDNQLGGIIPSSIGNLSNLLVLSLGDNNISGSIPAEIGNLSNLTTLQLYKTNLSGEIPTEIGNLSNLQYLQLYENYLNGSIPASVGNLTNLSLINLSDNMLSGNIPPELGNLPNLKYLKLKANQIEGSIPASLGNLSKLNILLLNNNKLSGNIPPELGNLVDLIELRIQSNKLKGEIPTTMTNLTNLGNQWTDIGYNALYANNETLDTFLDEKDTDWEETQTVAPCDVSATSLSNNSIEVSWTPIYYTAGSGGYTVHYSTISGGPYTAFDTTVDKTGSSMIVTGLTPATTYYFVVHTRTDSHDNNQNIVESEYSEEVSATTTPLTSTISGFITFGGTGLENVLMNGLPGSPTPKTDASGFYTAVVNHGWSGTVTPTLPGYAFIDPSTTYANVTSDQSTNYTATLLTYTISGTVTHGGAGLENVILNGLPGSPMTDVNGSYTSTVNYGWSGSATPTLNDYSFTPSFSTYTNVTSNLTANYTAYLTDQIPPIERQALIDLYVSSNGDNWINNSGWKTPPLHTDGFAMPGTEDTWYGVTVESNNHVSSIKLGSNGLIGTIPASIGDLAYLTEIQLYTNQLTGSMPIEIGSLTGLEIIDMSSNQLSGTIPTEIGNLVNLRFLYLYANQLTGSIPPSLGNCLDLIRLYLDENQLTGRVPDELCNLTSLERFDFSSNKIIGNIPSCITNLTSLSDSFTDSGYNALYTNDEDVRIFLTSKDPDWEETQTTAPTNVSAEAVSGNSVQLSWTPILYSADPGGYQVYCGTISGGPYSLFDITADKTVSSMTVNGLIPDTIYYFVVRTRTESHNNNQNVVVSDYSEDATATTFPGGPSIVVTSPNGGEIWEAGSSQNITWISSGITRDVKIDYSTDGGTSWTVIVPSLDNDGTFGWVVPDVPSENCLVRISESDVDEGLWDVSDRIFSITSQASPNVRVTSPNGGERLAVGSACGITWASSGAVGDIKIDYSVDNGVSWTNIVASTENDGSYSWAVPDVQSDSCVVRIGETDGEPCDMSDGVFSIVPASSLTVTSPNGGESWEVGSFYKIRWTGDGNIEEVRIELSTDNGTSWSHIVESTANDGVYNWGVPGMPSDQCLVRVGKTDSDMGPSDVSDAVFSIVPQTAPTLWVTSPNGGESWEVGSSHQISWTSSGAIGDVRIEYSVDGGTSWATIVQSTQNDGAHNWTVPDTPSANCLVRITESDSDAGPTDVSDAVFSIVPSSTANLIIASPNGGERLTVGSTHEITWTSSGTVGEIKIEYSTDNGVSWSELAASTENDGSHSWVVPDVQSDGCLVRASETDGAPADTSDAAFSIVKSVSITVLAPNGGESWEACSSHDITWAGSGNINNVKVEYSADSGVSWTTIVESTANDGVYNWMVPDAQSDACLVKVSRPGSDEEVWDISDTLFSITPSPTPTIKITSPNGGERLIIDSIHEITWVSSGTVGGISIEYSTDMGTTWTMIAPSVEDSGTYNWTVPGIPSESCLVRVSEEDGDPSDVSDDLFYIDRSNSITVTRPNGGESWKVGSTNDITWINDETIGEVKIEYSTDNGNSWIIISPSTENSGSYDWAVPDTPADQCLVRVSSLDADEEYWDVSDDVFSIVIDTPLRLTSPNGEDSLCTGEHFPIEWQSDQTIGNVKIEFSPDKGSTYSVINASVPNIGSYNWIAPGQISPNCLIRISDANRRKASRNVLIYRFKFRIFNSETFNTVDKSFIIWLGDALNEAVKYTLPIISFYSESNGHDYIQLNDDIKEIQSLSEKWHTLEILFDQQKRTISLWLDRSAIFENCSLSPASTFTPSISLSPGSQRSSVVSIDDLFIMIYDSTEEVKEFVTLFSEDFESFEEEMFPENSGWKRSMGLNEKSKAVIVSRDSISGKYLKLQIIDQNPVIAVKQFNIPENLPFDVSDGSFTLRDD